MHSRTFGRLLALTIAMLMVIPAIPVIQTDDSDATGLDFSKDYYYNQLSESDKGLYREIYGCALNFSESLETGRGDWGLRETGGYILGAVRYDHPELFWLTNNCTYNEAGLIRFQYSMSKTEVEDAQAQIDDFVSNMTVDETDRKSIVDSLNSEIVSNTVYDKSAVGKTDAYYAHCITGVFIDGKAVCEGYALAFKYLCDIYDIPCICVVGEAVSGSERIGHMWNYVMMDGPVGLTSEKWYAMDVTWNDPLVGGYDSGTVHTDYTLVGKDSIIDLKKFCDTHILGNLSTYVDVPEIQLLKFILQTGPDGKLYFAFPSTYYYEKLTANGKIAYAAILEGVLNFENIIETGVIGDKAALDDARFALRLDRQDLFYIPRIATINSAAGTIEMEYSLDKASGTVTVTKETYDSMCNEILLALAPLEKELDGCEYDYQKVLAIHDYLVNSISYKKVGNAWSIYGALVEKQCVCEGYARTFQYVCALYGVEAIVVSGTGSSSGTGSENHMWNLVKMNYDIWYGMDVTWDDPVGQSEDSETSYTYFLVGTMTFNTKGRTFAESHVVDWGSHPAGSVFEDKLMPEISSVDYYIRPNSAETYEYVMNTTSSQSGAVFRESVTYAELEYALDRIQGVGVATMMFDDYSKIGMDAKNLEMLLSYMSDSSKTEMAFTSTHAKEKVNVIAVDMENTVYRFGIDGGIKLSDIGEGFTVKLYIPYKASGIDFVWAFIFAWDVASPTVPLPDCQYDGTYVSVPVTTLDTGYFVGSTPIEGVSVIALALGAMTIVFILLLILRHRHKKKKRARKERRN